MTELLKITHIQDDICEVSATVLDKELGVLLSAAILGAMVQDEYFASAVMAAAAAYAEDAEAVKEVGRRNTITVPPSGNTLS